VVRRLCLDHHRHHYGRSRDGPAGDLPQAERAKRRRLVDLVADQIDPALLAAPAHGVPDALLARSELARALSLVLEGLPPRDRLLLRLRFGEDLPAREIARLMSFPTLFHVYRRLDKVLVALRTQLQELGVDGSEP